MALTQTRPYELDIYVDEVDASELDIMVDHESFTEPLRVRGLFSGAGGTHIEKDTLTGLSSRTVTVEFDTVFSSIPVGWVKVYRMTEMPDGTYRDEDVLWGYTTSTKVSTNGFVLKISDDESLTGVVVEYKYE
jgi:hypothetical protein